MEGEQYCVLPVPPLHLNPVISVNILLFPSEAYAVSKVVKLRTQKCVHIVLHINLSLGLLGAMYMSEKYIIRIYEPFGLQP